MARPVTGLSEARPFAGLRAFDLRDAKFFFGRSDQMAALYRLVDRNRFVAVIGSSGSGKSSLTRAGLFRILEQENQEGRSAAPWVRCTLRPGDAPLNSLTDALTRLLPDKGDAQGKGDPQGKRDRIEHLLTSSTFGCADAITEAGVEANARFVLVIDQFEELFRYSDQRQGPDAARNTRAYDQAQQFVELLLEASRSRARAIHVLITMRSDFIGECAQFPGLAEAVSSTQFLVPGLTDDQLEEIIRRPIELANSTIESDLVQQLMINSSKDLDELPVLQHCLLQLWKQAGRPAGDDSETEADDSEPQTAPVPRHITLAHYDQVGRLSGALSKHANRIMRGFGEADVAAVFRALSEIRNGRAIRRALPYAHLREEAGLKDEKLRPIVDRFRADDCSFLLTSPANVEEITDKTRIDICHEALLRRWEKCGGTAEVAAAHQTGPAIGWLEQERRDGQDYQFLLSKAENRKSWLVEDIKSHQKWWEKRHPTERWAERYGGGYAAVQQMLGEGGRNRRLVQTGVAVLVLAAIAIIGNQEWRSHQAKVQADKAELQARNNGRIAQASLNLGRKVLHDALGELNHGRMQVHAALQIESAMTEIIDKDLSPGGENGKPAEGIRLSSEVYELKSELDYTAADILYDAGNWEEALKRANASQVEADILLKRNPDNKKWQAILCESTQRLGDAQELNRNYNEALDQFRRAQGLARDIDNSPAAEGLCKDSDYYHSRAGDMLLTLGDPKGAYDEFNQALDIARTNAKDPNDKDSQASVPRYITKLGQALAAQGEVKQAVAQFDEALRLQEALAKAGDAALLSNLAISDFQKAAVVGDADAIDLYKKAIRIHTDLIKNKDSGKASWLTLLAAEQHGLADTYQRQTLDMASTDDPETRMKHFNDAVTTYGKELETRQELLRADENNDKLKQDVASVDSALAGARANFDAAKSSADASAQPETKN
jgi:energy-coupling factor transporter ATP-binding protein EcfA2